MKRQRKSNKRGETTVVSSANKSGGSVRTTIPIGIASQVPINIGTELLWLLDKDGDDWVITIRINKK